MGKRLLICATIISIITVICLTYRCLLVIKGGASQIM